MINRLEYMREYRKKNKEEYKEYYRTYMREVYYPKHRDEITAYQRQFRRKKNEAGTL